MTTEPPTPLIGPDADRLHLMTYNLRYPADDPGHRWEDRRPALAALLALEQPAILCTQEGYFGQVRDVAGALPAGYEWVGEGRAGGSDGEFMAVFFDARRFTPLAYDHLWLSDTPRIIASTSWGNRLPRTVTWVRLADVVSGAEFVVVNTHLDNHSENARARAAELLAGLVASFGATPVVLSGDFNDVAETSEAYKTLVRAGLTDAWLTAADRLTPAYGTFGHYREPVTGGNRIDWIFTSSGIAVDAAAINPAAPDGRYPSDHLPVQVTLRMPGPRGDRA